MLKGVIKNLLIMSDEDFEHFDLPSKKIFIFNLDHKLGYDNYSTIEYD